MTATIEPAAYSAATVARRCRRRHRVTWLSSLLFHARFLVKLCVESNVTNDPCHRIFFAHKRQTICGTCYSHPPGQIRAVQPVLAGQTGSLAVGLLCFNSTHPYPSVFFNQCAIADVISKGASLYEILISDCR